MASNSRNIIDLAGNDHDLDIKGSIPFINIGISNSTLTTHYSASTDRDPKYHSAVDRVELMCQPSRGVSIPPSEAIVQAALDACVRRNDELWGDLCRWRFPAKENTSDETTHHKVINDTCLSTVKCSSTMLSTSWLPSEDTETPMAKPGRTAQSSRLISYQKKRLRSDPETLSMKRSCRIGVPAVPSTKADHGMTNFGSDFGNLKGGDSLSAQNHRQIEDKMKNILVEKPDHSEDEIIEISSIEGGTRKGKFTEQFNENGSVTIQDETEDLIISLDETEDLVIDLDETEDLIIDLDETEGSIISLDEMEDFIIDLDDSEDLIYREAIRLSRANRNSQTIERRDSRRSRRESSMEQPRNQPVTPPWILCKSLKIASGRLTTSSVIELMDQNFFHVAVILKNQSTEEVMLRGYFLARSRNLNGKLPRQLNELCWLAEIDLDDPRECLHQSMSEIPLDKFVAFRELRITNQLFPKGSFRDTWGFSDRQVAEGSAPCTMRWKYICKYRTASDRRHNRWLERSLERYQYNEVSASFHGMLPIKNIELRYQYRGRTVLGGAHEPPPNSSLFGSQSPPSIISKTFIVLEDGKPPTSHSPEQAKISSSNTIWPTPKKAMERIDLTDEANEYAKLEEDRSDIIVVDSETRASELMKPRLLSSIDLTGSAFLTPPDYGFIPSPSQLVLRIDAPAKIVRGPGQRYTYGDCFCGAGGASRGAMMAGLKILWGFDADDHACSTWKLNFPFASNYKMWAHEFYEFGRKSGNMKVDVIHLSPPCQYFSPAHTVEGKNDEMNSASLFACGDILDVVKPRIATLEQTFGIVLLPRFQAYFNALIHMFTIRGFSVRWTIAHLQNWGLPQRRQRLLMIASWLVGTGPMNVYPSLQLISPSPGEVLPEFPQFTHADPRHNMNDLIPWASVNSVLSGIPPGTPNHDLAVVEAKRLNCAPWPGDSIAPRCITTHGGHNYHPSGKRGFTNREYAALQGFPHDHMFSSFNVKKQIGNAVPPSIAKVLFDGIRRALEKADGVESNVFAID